MSSELTVLNNSTEVQQGGLGVDFSSKLFQLKPATLGVVQKNTTLEGATPGRLRISDTGQQFEEVFATLLRMPTEGRQYHVGPPGELNRNPENLFCFSRDMQAPDPKSKVPQALLCSKCPRSDWGPWRESKEKNGFADKSLIPACDPSYYILLIDTVYQLPLQMYIRSKAREPFEQGMQNLARTLAIGKAQGKNPNLFDVKFRIKTKQITTGKFTSYVPVFENFEYVSDEEREKFGEIYLQFINRSKTQDQLNAVAEAEAEVDNVQSKIDSSVVEGEYVNESGEITI
jgi:hypothetical protein